MKKVYIILIVLLALTAILVFSLPFLIDINRYKDTIAQKIEAALQKKTELGEIRLKIFGGAGIDAAGLKVREGKLPADNVLFECERLAIRFKLIPLLSKKIEISRVDIYSPRLSIKRDRLGNFNFLPPAPVKPVQTAQVKQPDKKGASKNQKKAKAVMVPAVDERGKKPDMTVAPSKPFHRMDIKAAPEPNPAFESFTLDNLTIVNGTVIFTEDNPKKPLKIMVENLGASINGIAPRGSLKFKLAGNYNGAGKFKLSGSAGKIPQDFDFKRHLQDISFSAQISFKDCDFTQVASYVKTHYSDIPAIGGPLDLDAAVKGSAKDVSADIKLDLKRSSLSYGNQFAKEKNVPLRIETKGVWRPKGYVKADSLSVIFNNSKLSCSGEARWGSPLFLKLNVSLDTALKDLLAFKYFKGLRPQGTAHLDLKLSTSQKGIDLEAALKKGAFIKEIQDLGISADLTLKDFETGILNRVTEGKGEYSGPADVEFKWDGTLRKGKFDGRADLTGAALKYSVIFAKPKQTPFSAAFIGEINGENSLKIQTLDLAYGNSSLKADGDIQNLADPKVNLRVNSKITMSDLYGLKDVKNYNPSGTVEIDLDLKGRLKDLKGARVNGFIDMNHLKFKPPALSKGGVEVNGTLKIADDRTDIKGFAVNVGSTALALNGDITGFESPRINFDLSMERFDMDELKLLFAKGWAARGMKAKPVVNSAKSVKKGTAAKKEPSGKSAGPGQRVFKNADMKGKVFIRELVYNNNVIRDCKSDVTIKSGILNLKEISLTGYEGRGEGSLSYNMAGGNGEFEATARVNGIDLNTFLSANTKLKNRIYGKLDADLELKGSGRDFEEIKNRLEGRGEIGVAEGKFTSINLLRNLSLISGIVGLNLPDINDTEFKDLKMTVDIDSGVLRSNDLKMNTEYFDLYGAGYFTLDMVINYDLNVKFTKDFTARLGGGELQRALTGSDGRMTMPFKISGRIDESPTFAPNWGDIIQKEAQYRLTRMIEKKLLKGKGEEPQPTQLEKIFAPASAEGTKKPSTKDTFKNILFDVLTESIEKGQEK